MYSIRLADGTEIAGLNLNGNNFIPEGILDKNVFVGNLDKIAVIDGDGNIEERFNQKVQFASIGEAETFILMDKSKDEVEKDTFMLALAQLDAQRELDKTETNLALAELAAVMIGGE